MAPLSIDIFPGETADQEAVEEHLHEHLVFNFTLKISINENFPVLAFLNSLKQQSVNLKDLLSASPDCLHNQLSASCGQGWIDYSALPLKAEDEDFLSFNWQVYGSSSASSGQIEPDSIILDALALYLFQQLAGLSGRRQTELMNYRLYLNGLFSFDHIGGNYGKLVGKMEFIDQIYDSAAGQWWYLKGPPWGRAF